MSEVTSALYDRFDEACLMRRQTARRSGRETTSRLSLLLDNLLVAEDVDTVTDALAECATGELQGSSR